MSNDFTLTVSDSQPHLRLDRFLAQNLNGVSRAYLLDYFAHRRILVNGRVARKSALVAPHQRVTIRDFIHPSDLQLQKQPHLVCPVLFQNDDFMIISKPSGMASHALTPHDTDTLANLIITRYPELAHVGGDPLRPAIAHRLDTGTSGAMMIAKSDAALEQIRKIFKSHTITKEYKALLCGHFPYLTKTVKVPVAHHPKSVQRMMAAASELDATRLGARNAVSHIHFEKAYGSDYTLVRVVIETGRRHQIRVHCSHIGFPVSGDPLYRNGGDLQRDWLNPTRPMLHSHRLKFEWKGEMIDVVAPFPSDFISNISKIPLEDVSHHKQES